MSQLVIQLVISVIVSSSTRPNYSHIALF